MADDENPILKVLRSLPLAPADCQLTPEERADIDRRLDDIRAGRVKDIHHG